MAEVTTTTTTTTLSERQKNRLRFEGLRYSLQGSAMSMPSEIVPRDPGLMTFPRIEDESQEDH